MSSHKHKRRALRVIKPSFQFRLIGAFGGVTLLALFLQTIVHGASMTRSAGELGSDVTEVAIALPGILGRSLLFSSVVVFPALVLIGVRVTHRIAGPLYRMEQHLDAISRGERPGPCKIRKDDRLQGFCESLNRAILELTCDQDRAKEEPGDESDEACVVIMAEPSDALTESEAA